MLLTFVDLFPVVVRFCRDVRAVVVVLLVPPVDLFPAVVRFCRDLCTVVVVPPVRLTDLLVVLDLFRLAEVVCLDFLLLLLVVALGIADSPCIWGLWGPCNCARYKFFTEPHIGPVLCVLYL